MVVQELRNAPISRVRLAVQEDAERAAAAATWSSKTDSLTHEANRLHRLRPPPCPSCPLPPARSALLEAPPLPAAASPRPPPAHPLQSLAASRPLLTEEGP